MNQQQKGASNANQIKQANDHPRGAAEHDCSIYLDTIQCTVTQQWNDVTAVILQITRDLDTSTPQNESDALRRIGDR